MVDKAKKKPSKKDLAEQSAVEELTADLQRIQADFVNYKRRAEEDRIKSVSFGKQLLAQQLLPVIDNIERALKNVPEDLKDNDYVKGIQAVAKQLQTSLEGAGITKIKTVDEEFDHELMEAVSMEDGEGEKEVVIEELQSGYVMDEQVIRHAMVRVGRK